MERMEFYWQVGFTKNIKNQPEEWMSAKVPGAVQLDYAKHNNWPPFYEGTNYSNYAWMEDVYWVYRTQLNFAVNTDEYANLCFKAIDYKYIILIDGQEVYRGEGMFTPVKIDVTRFSGCNALLEVIILPAPKVDNSNTRRQARESCKSVACYGWDWHPRLITAGIWDDAYLEINPLCNVEDIQITYKLSDELDTCLIHVEAFTKVETELQLYIEDSNKVVAESKAITKGYNAVFEVELKNPSLWYPVGYGEQHRYTVSVCCSNGAKIQKKVGFRRAKMVMNEHSWDGPKGFPKSRNDAPATLEINGIRIFAKGSNWVNAQVFPSEMTDELYNNLLSMVRTANMNILRIWGGGFVNKERFYDRCDELGIMIWQEFPLACNEYPDNDSYLSVLENEAKGIIKRLRTHPSVVLWCGGNELFNSWSRMTEQYHALRLLDKLCYTYDRYTPFIMTSPLNGMAHGSYVNYDEVETHQEFITDIVNSYNTAYTEFGCPGMSTKEQLLTFMSEDDFNDCNKDNPVWLAHHGFNAWRPLTWVRFPEVEYYFGGYSSMEDFIEKTNFIQCMCYKSAFEEMRRQWPHCSMALNWCFNEPWPVAGNNSLVMWPDKPKKALYAVAESLRPQLASLRVERHRWLPGEQFTGEIWLLNDSLNSLDNVTVEVSYSIAGKVQKWGSVNVECVPAQENVRCGFLSFDLPMDYDGDFDISLNVVGKEALNSKYTYLCRNLAKSKPKTSELNV